MRAVCDRTIRWGLVVLMVFTPLAFGTVEPWAITIMEWGIVTLILVFGLSRAWPDGGVRPPRIRPTGMEIPIGLFVLLCASQTVPLPRSWLKVIAPGSARLYQDVDFRKVVEAQRPTAAPETVHDPLLDLEAQARRPVSADPLETWSRIRLLSILAGLFLLAAWWAEGPERILFLLKATTVVGFLVALEGLVQYLTWNGKIFWFRRVPPAGAFGPFVNHNHFAGYVEMVIPVAISLTFYLVEERRRPAFLDEPGRWAKVGLALFASVLLLVSLFFSISRGGILSALASGLILFGVLWRRIRSRALKWSVAAALPAAVLFLVFWIGGETVQHNLKSFQTLHGEASFRLRVLVWKRVLDDLPDYLWVGAGLGAFEESFAPLTPPGSPARWDRAHNDYLQLLWETGAVGTLIFLAGSFVFVRRYWAPAISRRSHALDLFRVAIAVSLLSIALHSLVDFNLQIGSNGFLFALLAGLLVALGRMPGGEPAVSPMLVQGGGDSGD